LVEAGLNVSISTDDPGWFATDLTSELQIAANLLRATPEAMVGLQQSALEASFAPDDERRAIAAELGAVAVS
jgi:aminodeoxyfutalosine deaminase